MGGSRDLKNLALSSVPPFLELRSSILNPKSVKYPPTLGDPLKDGTVVGGHYIVPF